MHPRRRHRKNITYVSNKRLLSAHETEGKSNANPSLRHQFEVATDTAKEKCTETHTPKKELPRAHGHRKQKAIQSQTSNFNFQRATCVGNKNSNCFPWRRLTARCLQKGRCTQASSETPVGAPANASTRSPPPCLNWQHTASKMMKKKLGKISPGGDRRLIAREKTAHPRIQAFSETFLRAPVGQGVLLFCHARAPAGESNKYSIPKTQKQTTTPLLHPR